jgi:hypothetical protein
MQFKQAWVMEGHMCQAFMSSSTDPLIVVPTPKEEARRMMGVRK